jgi:hypothetical protein
MEDGSSDCKQCRGAPGRRDGCSARRLRQHSRVGGHCGRHRRRRRRQLAAAVAAARSDVPRAIFAWWRPTRMPLAPRCRGPAPVLFCTCLDCCLSDHHVEPCVSCSFLVTDPLTPPGDNPPVDRLEAAARLVANHKAVTKFALRGPGKPGKWRRPGCPAAKNHLSPCRFGHQMPESDTTPCLNGR